MSGDPNQPPRPESPHAMKPDPQQALAMLEIFRSLGVESFDLTLTDLAGEKVGYRPGRRLEALKQIMPTLLAEATLKQQNVIIRPPKKTGTARELVQLDDLQDDAAARIQPHAFLIIRTSGSEGNGNYQAWVAVNDAQEDFARRLRKGAGADPTASGATRVSGIPNFKAKYDAGISGGDDHAERCRQGSQPARTGSGRIGGRSRTAPPPCFFAPLSP